MQKISKEDLAAIEDAKSSKKTKMNEIGIAKLPNISLTQSEKTGEKPKIEKLRHHKDIAKLNELCKSSY